MFAYAQTCTSCKADARTNGSGSSMHARNSSGVDRTDAISSRTEARLPCGTVVTPAKEEGIGRVRHRVRETAIRTTVG